MVEDNHRSGFFPKRQKAVIGFAQPEYKGLRVRHMIGQCHLAIFCDVRELTKEKKMCHFQPPVVDIIRETAGAAPDLLISKSCPFGFRVIAPSMAP